MVYNNDNFQNIINIIIREHKKSEKRPFVVLVDGRSGSGKSTFAKKVEETLGNSKSLNLDAYTLRSGDFFAPELVKIEHKLDWENTKYQLSKIQTEIKNSKSDIIILEGSFSFKNLNGIWADLKIFVDCTKEFAAARLNNREINERVEINPEIIFNSTFQWQLAEDRYYTNFDPKNHASIIISTTNLDYQLVVDRTEWRPQVQKFKEFISVWWSETFPNQGLETIEIANHGMNCTYILNSKFVLKVLAPKYTWDKSTETSLKSKIIESYTYIQNNNSGFSPNILLAEYSSVFQEYYILSEYLPNKDLYQLYYQSSSEQKAIYLDEFVFLIKSFHQNCKGKIHGDLHFSNVLVNQEKLYLIDFDNMTDGDISNEFYGIIQGLLLPVCCVTEDLEIYYSEPLISEFEEVIRQYPEILPIDKIEKSKETFRDCFDQKLKLDKFRVGLEPLYHKVFEENWFENLANKYGTNL